jgi:putative FmdB family regulatory protein
MPLYEYECDACGHRFEVIQKFSDAPLETCEKCGGTVRKLLSSPAIQFKGSGWYITDYARAGKGEAKSDNGSSSATKSDGASTSESKSETKSEAKPESKSDAKTKADAKSDSKPAAPSTS